MNREEQKSLLAHKSFFATVLQTKNLPLLFENADWAELKILLQFLFWLTSGKIPISKQLAKKLLNHRQYPLLKRRFTKLSTFEKLLKWNRSRHIVLLKELKGIIKLTIPILKKE